MKTVVLGDPPPALASLIAERQRLGLDRRDEVWEGDYHMVPGPSGDHAHLGSRIVRFLGPYGDRAGLVGSLEFNIGRLGDFRVPDLGFHRDVPTGVWQDGAAVVVEIRSPWDETYEKFGFYFDHGVEELLVVEPEARSVQWYARGTDRYEPADRSALLSCSAEELLAGLGW